MTPPRSIQVQVVSDADMMADRLADWLIQLAFTKGDPFSVCLSGGSTPKTLYERLADPRFCDRFPWRTTHLFFGDERFVPSDDPLSNYRMVREALLDRIEIPGANVHAVPTEGLSPETAAQAYEAILKAFHGSDRLDPARPLFDVTLLGLGEDGHTASLFPGTAVLKERTRWVAPVIGAKAEARITLTYPALESSRHTVFLVSGAAKREILQRLTAGDQSLPAARINPSGSLVVFCDSAAAGM